MKVGIYARVSTEDKDQTVDRQTLMCRRYCELKGHQVIGQFCDKMTGDSSPFKREGFKSLLSQNIDGIVIYSMDRLTRQHPLKVFKLINQVKERGLKIMSITEPIFNMEGDMAEPMQYLLTWFNNYFLVKLKDNVKSGIERARHQGKSIGRPSKKYNKYKAFNLLFNEKKSLRYVSKELGVPLTTIQRFKKVCENDRDSFIKYGGSSETDGLEHPQNGKV
jgi:putative DNA-invertase from lambdoid prophage Rac